MLTPTIIKKNISYGVEQWCEAIREMSRIERIDLSAYVAENGFSITNTVKYLENVYSKNAD